MNMETEPADAKELASECDILARLLKQPDNVAVDAGQFRSVMYMLQRIHWAPRAAKIDAMHDALFNKETGLMTVLTTLNTVRKWLVITAISVTSAVTSAIVVAAQLHKMGMI